MQQKTRMIAGKRETEPKRKKKWLFSAISIELQQ